MTPPNWIKEYLLPVFVIKKLITKKIYGLGFYCFTYIHPHLSSSYWSFCLLWAFTELEHIVIIIGYSHCKYPARLQSTVSLSASTTSDSYNFLLPFPQWYISPEIRRRRNVRDVALRTEHSQSLVLWTLTSCRSLSSSLSPAKVAFSGEAWEMH